MNALRLVTQSAPAAGSQRPAPGRQGSAAEAVTDRLQPPTCEYADIGRGNGFLLEHAGERPVLNVIGEIG